jgi:hypothetical protein
VLEREKECVRVKERDDVDVCWGRERMCACVCVKEREKEREKKERERERHDDDVDVCLTAAVPCHT